MTKHATFDPETNSVNCYENNKCVHTVDCCGYSQYWIDDVIENWETGILNVTCNESLEDSWNTILDLGLGPVAEKSEVREDDEFKIMKSDMRSLESRQELLVILMEECAELQQACAKLLRRGIMYDSSDKYVTQLKEEAGDVYAMLELLHEWDVVSLFEMEERRKIKFDQLKKWSSLL